MQPTPKAFCIQTLSHIHKHPVATPFGLQPAWHIRVFLVMSRASCCKPLRLLTGLFRGVLCGLRVLPFNSRQWLAQPMWCLDYKRYLDSCPTLCRQIEAIAASAAAQQAWHADAERRLLERLRAAESAAAEAAEAVRLMKACCSLISCGQSRMLCSFRLPPAITCIQVL